MRNDELLEVYIDEAGNTGQDLLNPDQKVFVLASNSFLPRDTETLIALFPNKAEIHFKELKNSKAGRKAILDFLNHPLISEKHIHCSVINKEYAAVAQIVDQLIEPVLYKSGIDIYRFGQNITITNFIFYFGNFFWDKALYFEILDLFIEMMRTKNEITISEFYSQIEILHRSIKKREKDLIELILVSQKYIKTILIGIDKFSLDVTLSCFYVLCDLWYKKTGKRLAIYQDSSKQIDHFKEYIEFTRKLNISKREVGFDSRRITFPTQIEKLELVSSGNCLGIQISDLIASALAFMYSNKNPKQKLFVENIQSSKLLQLDNFHTVWPNTSVTPQELGMSKGEGENILDFLAINKLKDD